MSFKFIINRSFLFFWLTLSIYSLCLATDYSKIEDLLAPITTSVKESIDPETSPGIVFQAIWKDEVIYSHHYGLADIENGTPLTSSTAIRLASLSKAFTAMAVMILADEKKLSVDSPVHTIIPELRHFKDITIRHLLNHTSGIPDYYNSDLILNDNYDMKCKMRNQDLVALYQNWGELKFTPGSRFQYSNPGYEVLALIIERIAEKKYGDFLNCRIFEPLGMMNSVVRENPDVLVEHSALGYRKSNDKKQQWIVNDEHWANGILGAGGIYASLDDLRKWTKAIRNRSLISEEMSMQAFASVELSDGSTSSYGFGWVLSKIKGHHAIHHTGSWVGFRTAIAIFPDNDLEIIVLSNSSTANPAMLRNTIAEFLLKELID
ncbi:MAG: beta-lactamase family protein [Opitutales bacterium]|nr:beta-lactamase family protein [Opitutales bacterium]